MFRSAASKKLDRTVSYLEIFDMCAFFGCPQIYFKDQIRFDLWFHALHELRYATQSSTVMPGPSHPDTHVRYTGDDDTPLKCKPRDSARSALLFKSVRNRRSGLALQLHPPEGYNTALRPLTGAAEYAWGAGWR